MIGDEGGPGTRHLRVAIKELACEGDVALCSRSIGCTRKMMQLFSTLKP